MINEEFHIIYSFQGYFCYKMFNVSAVAPSGFKSYFTVEDFLQSSHNSVIIHKMPLTFVPGKI